MAEQNLVVAILEKQILNCFLKHNDLIDKYNDLTIFISPQAQEMYVDLKKLREEHKAVTVENILTLEGNEFITSDMLIAVQETEYEVESIDDYIERLTDKSLIHEFKNEILPSLQEDSSDYEKLDEIQNRISELKSKVSLKTNDDSSFPSLIREYKEEIKKRASGNKNTTGDYNLDKLIGGFDAGIVLLLGMSGSMKSTFTIKILRNRITKRLPTCAFNTELTHGTYMDTMVSPMINEDYNNLRGYTAEDNEMMDWDSILNKLDELEKVYEKIDSKRKLFNFYPKNSVSIADIKKFCIKCRKEYRLKKDETLFCTIDLLLMVRDMNKSGTSRADAITQGINELNEFALKENILFFATVQAKRKSYTVKINELDDLNEFKLSTEVIKESGSLEERSRAIIALHNPKYLANKNPCSQVIRDLVDPILELTVLKNSWKENLGQTIYYYIDSDHKDLVDYEPKEGEIPNSSVSTLHSTEEKDDVTARLEKQLED